MSADVVCMSLANVPPGEQRSRFLAVGLVDNTVRIISLDPSVRAHPPSHNPITWECFPVHRCIPLLALPHIPPEMEVEIPHQEATAEL